MSKGKQATGRSAVPDGILGWPVEQYILKDVGELSGMFRTSQSPETPGDILSSYFHESRDGTNGKETNTGKPGDVNISV